MKIVAFDTETFLITPGLLAPPLVCVSTFDGQKNELFDKHSGLVKMKILLSMPDVILVGHNIAYDFGVLCAADKSFISDVFHAYQNGRVRDTKIRQKLFDLADGTLRWSHGDKPVRKKFSLKDLAARHLGKHLEKENTWRLKYDQLSDVPIANWPEDAKTYALEDAKTTFEVYEMQNNLFRNKPYMVQNNILRNELEQTKAAWGLHLISTWGIRTDEESIRKLKNQLLEEKAKYSQEIIAAGLVRSNGTKDTEAIRNRIQAAYGDREIPRTEKTQKIQTSAAVLNESGDPLLEKLVEFEETSKLLSDFVPKLEQGTKAPINPSYDEMVSSGRTSSYSPNIQQLPRKGGIRECFIPRPGFIFIGADYAVLELCSLAQVCLDVFKFSNLAEALKVGKDPHLMVTSQLLKTTYDDVLKRFKEGDKEVKEYRQISKVIGYGYPGGMSPKTFVTYAAGQGFKVTEKDATVGRNAWFETWPEMKKYFTWVGSQLGPIGEGEVVQCRSGRVRYVDSFTAACNTFFQGLAADGAKEAIFRVSKECYLPTGSALYGSRIVAFIHDEIICEAPEAKASEAAERLAQVMIESMQVYIPDIPIKAEPFAMRRWLKGAETVRDENGKLKVWE